MLKRLTFRICYLRTHLRILECYTLFFLAPAEGFGGPSSQWPNNSWSHVPPNICAEFWVSSMIRSVSRTSPSSSMTWITEGSWMETWRICVILDILNVLQIWFQTYFPNFSFLAWLEVCWISLYHHQWLGGHWEFLTRRMEGMRHSLPHYWSWHLIPCLCTKFSIIAWLEVCQELPIIDGDTWRTLWVPDKRLWAQGLPWQNKYTWQTPMSIPWKYKINIFIFGSHKGMMYTQTNKLTEITETYYRFASVRVCSGLGLCNWTISSKHEPLPKPYPKLMQSQLGGEY